MSKLGLEAPLGRLSAEGGSWEPLGRLWRASRAAEETDQGNRHRSTHLHPLSRLHGHVTNQQDRLLQSRPARWL